MRTTAVKLADCAEVLPGFSMQGRVEHDPTGTHQVILARHLKDEPAYDYREADHLKIIPARDAERYVLQPGDVLFMSRGSRNTAVVIGSIPNPTIAPLSFYVLRPKPGVDPAYLAWCLNQAPVQAAIGQIRTGAGTPLVPRKEFGEITIPLPPIEVQRTIARLGALMSREKQLVAQLRDATDRAHRLLGQQLMDSLHTQHEKQTARSTP